MLDAHGGPSVWFGVPIMTLIVSRHLRSARPVTGRVANYIVRTTIDQRYELLVNYKTHARSAGNVHGSVDCVVVAGRTPADPAQLSSFQLGFPRALVSVANQ